MNFDDLPPEKQIEVQLQVKYFTQVLLYRYGIKEDEIPAIVDALREIVKQQERWESARKHGLFVTISTLIGAALLVIWEGIKHIHSSLK